MLAFRPLLNIAQRTPVLCLPFWLRQALQYQQNALLMLTVAHGMAAGYSLSFLMHAKLARLSCALILAVGAFIKGRDYFDRDANRRPSSRKVDEIGLMSMWTHFVIFLSLPVWYVLKRLRVYSQSNRIGTPWSARLVAFAFQCACWVPAAWLVLAVTKAIADPNLVERSAHAPLHPGVTELLQEPGVLHESAIWLNYVVFAIEALGAFILISWLLWFLIGTLLRMFAVCLCVMTYNLPQLSRPSLSGLNWIVALLETLSWPRESLDRMRLLVNVQCDASTWNECKFSLVQTAFKSIVDEIEFKMSQSSLRLLKRYTLGASFVLGLLLMATAGWAWWEPKSAAKLNFYFALLGWIFYCTFVASSEE